MSRYLDASILDTWMEQAKAEGIHRFSVGAGIINEDGAMLVLKRKPDDSFPGMYEIPGGGVDEDETLFEAICRETREETGLTVKEILRFCGTFDYDEKGRTRQFSFLVSVESADGIRLSEHDNYLWIYSAEKLHCTNEMRQVIKNISDAYQEYKQ